MYKLLIVDDEDIEREGMAQLINWEEYKISLVGTAWNGEQGLQKIKAFKPDLVLTDIKMPGMDGIEMIHQAKQILPQVEYVVLSGYGDFDYTSRAMQEGIRHYILKPCNSEKIIKVFAVVLREIDELRMKNRKTQEYQHTVRSLLPRAKEQIFRNMLLDREQIKADSRLLMDEIGALSQQVEVLAFRKANGFDYLEQYMLENVMAELLGEHGLLFSASIGQDVLLLLSADAEKKVESAVTRTLQEFSRFQTELPRAAVSDAQKPDQIRTLYLQTQELFQIGSAQRVTGLLSYAALRGLQKDAASLIPYQKMREARSYAQILFECYLCYLKLKLCKAGQEQQQQLYSWILKLLYGNSEHNPALQETEEWKQLVRIADYIYTMQGETKLTEKEQCRARQILLAVYHNLHDEKISAQFLAKEVLFMNEDYFGRTFIKLFGIKFSDFLMTVRIRLAARLLQYHPDLKMGTLAALVGYSADGQYFSKAFRRIVGVAPTKYKNFVKNKQNIDF